MIMTFKFSRLIDTSHRSQAVKMLSLALSVTGLLVRLYAATVQSNLSKPQSLHQTIYNAG